MAHNIFGEMKKYILVGSFQNLWRLRQTKKCLTLCLASAVGDGLLELKYGCVWDSGWLDFLQTQREPLTSPCSNSLVLMRHSNDLKYKYLFWCKGGLRTGSTDPRPMAFVTCLWHGKIYNFWIHKYDRGVTFFY